MLSEHTRLTLPRCDLVRNDIQHVNGARGQEYRATDAPISTEYYSLGIPGDPICAAGAEVVK